MLEIPLQPVPAQELQVLLDDQACTLALHWRHWRLYADLYVGDEAAFIGAVCLNGQAINQSPSTVFSGTLMFVDTLGAQHPEWEGLGDRWALLYLNSEEMEGFTTPVDAMMAALDAADEAGEA